MSNDEGFFREVSEDLRSDRFKALWNRFGIYFIALVVLLVVGTAAKVGYDYWSAQAAAQSGDRFLAALNLADDDKPDEALEALKGLEADGHGAYPVLARMRAATLLANEGKTQEAIDAYSAIGKSGSVPETIRDAARIRAGYLLVDHGSYEDVAGEVEPLSDADNPFRHSARQALGLAAWKAGDMKQAKKWFDLIAGDTAAPANISSQARLMLDLIAAGDKAA